MRFIRKHRRWNHYLVAGKIRLPSGKILNYYGEIKTGSAISDILIEGQWLDLLQINEFQGNWFYDDDTEVLLVSAPYLDLTSADTITYRILYPNAIYASNKSYLYLKTMSPTIITAYSNKTIQVRSGYSPKEKTTYINFPVVNRHILYIESERFYYKQEV